MSFLENVKKLPAKPGIYMFKDADGVVLYVGKAINLKNRVGSYFGKSDPSTTLGASRPWIAVMMGLVADIETIVVENELEALLLESTLIKEHEPKFNIKLTDDKSYPFIQLSKKESFPRFSVVRRKREKDGAVYFGPFLSGRYARYTLEFLRSLYGVHLSNKPLKHQDRPCFYCQLTGNGCVLAGEISEEAYRENINKAVHFLQGKRKSLINDLREKMGQAAEREQYELAAKLRDRLEALEHATTRQQVVSTDFEDYDAIGIYQTTTQAAIAVMSVREGRLIGQKEYFFSHDINPSQPELLRQFLISYYRTISNLPKLVAVPVAVEDGVVIEKMLAEVAGHPVELHLPQRGDKRQMLELACKNAQAKLELKMLKRGSAIGSVIALQELLSLPFLPERVEAIDISNLGASEAVGACVCFINGEPSKDDYRRYIIKSVSGQNDFAMIREVVARRLHDTARPVPDLLVIDGGPEQLKAAIRGSEQSKLYTIYQIKSPGAVPPVLPKIIALAKKPDRVFVPGRKLPLPSSKFNKGLRFLARVRDEVHRFGINFQRQRQLKKSLKS